MEFKYASKKEDDDKEDVKEEAKELGEALAKRKKGLVSKKKVKDEKEDVEEEIAEKKAGLAGTLAMSKAKEKLKEKGLKGAYKDAKKKILYGESGEQEKKAMQNRSNKEHDADGPISKVVTGKKRQPKLYRPFDTSKRRIIQGRLPLTDADGTEVGLDGMRKGKRRLSGSAGKFSAPTKLAPVPNLKKY